MSEKVKLKTGTKGIIIILVLLILFFSSFAASAVIYIKSEDLIYAPDAAENSELIKRLGEKENEITELKVQLERYKAFCSEISEESETVFSRENKK